MKTRMYARRVEEQLMGETRVTSFDLNPIGSFARSLLKDECLLIMETMFRTRWAMHTKQLSGAIAQW